MGNVNSVEWFPLMVTDSQFWLADAWIVDMDTADYRQPLLVTSDQGAVVLTGVWGGVVQVAVTTEHSTEALPDFEITARASVVTHSGRLCVLPLGDHNYNAEIPLLSSDGPGMYEVHVSAVGREAAPQGVLDESVERYLISSTFQRPLRPDERPPAEPGPQEPQRL